MRKQGIDGWIEGGVHPLLKGLKDIKSFWESDYSMQREACIVKLLYKH